MFPKRRLGQPLPAPENAGTGVVGTNWKLLAVNWLRQWYAEPVYHWARQGHNNGLSTSYH